MRLKELIQIEDFTLKVIYPLTGASMRIMALESDSRKVKPNGLFAAFDGAGNKGADYIESAIKSGATAILCHPNDRGDDHKVAWLLSGNPRLTYARLMAKFYPEQPEHIVAITGTNGKTSIADFTAQIWHSLGLKSATIGTLGVLAEGYEKYTGLTTPDAAILHESLADLTELGVGHLAVEASSHGLDQFRLDGLKIQAAAFCNLTQDHFDYHGSFENYFRAKARLFEEILPCKATAVLNYDCEYFDRLKDICEVRGQRVISVGGEGADIAITNQTPTLYGQDISVTFDAPEGTFIHRISLPLVGGFQAMNLMTAFALVYAVTDELDIAKTIKGLSQIKPVKGRMEFAGKDEAGASIYVDYAHTPDALKVALESLRNHIEGGRLHVVFGCGGNRDTGKRLLMGEIAQKYADVAYVTDDNPRNEDAEIIRAMVLEGCPKAKNIADRKIAIETAVGNLKKGDILLVAGKGHEQGQIIGDEVIKFDDLTEVTQSLQVKKALQVKETAGKKKPNGKKDKK